MVRAIPRIVCSVLVEDALRQLYTRRLCKGLLLVDLPIEQLDRHPLGTSESPFHG